MKILSQLMNTVPDTTGKLATADASKGSLQSSFASVIGATVAASAQDGDAKLVKAQNVDTKKTSSPDSKKKSSSSSSDDVASVQPSLVESAPINAVVPVVPPVPQVDATPVTKGGTSADVSSAVNSETGSVEATQIAAQAAVPAITRTDSGVVVAGIASESGKSDSGVVASDATTAAPASMPSAQAVSSHVGVASPVQSSVPVPVASSVPSDAATAQPVDSAKGVVKQAISNAVSTPVANASTVDHSQRSNVASSVVPVNPIASPATAVVTPAATATTSSVNAASPAPVQLIEVAKEAVKQTVPNAVSTTAVSTSVVDHTQKSNAAPSIASLSQSASTTAPVAKPVIVASATAVTPATVAIPAAAAATPPTTSSPVNATTTTPETSPATAATSATATTPVADASSANVATLTVEQQATATSLAVSQQPVLQTANTVATSGSSANFQISTAKNAVSGVSSQGLVASKSRTASADQRSNRSLDTTDDNVSSTDSSNGSFVSQVVAPDAGAKEVVSNAKGSVDSAALAQSTQAAPISVAANTTPTHSGPAQNTSVAGNGPLPAQTTVTDSTQAAHALSGAQLIQSAHGSEMRLGMQSAEFGNISINTSLNRQALSAQISFDHSALGHALAAHLPAIAEKLGSAYGLQAKVELRDTGSNSSQNDSGNKESRGGRQSQGGNSGTSTAMLQSPVGALTSSNFTSTSSTVATSSRLDIRI